MRRKTTIFLFFLHPGYNLEHTTNFSDADWADDADSYVSCNAIENKIGADFADGRGFSMIRAIREIRAY